MVEDDITASGLYSLTRELDSNVELGVPAKRWIRDWSSDQKDLTLLYHATKILRPGFIVETGTFEGHGTYVMARAAHENANGARILTIDYDGDPSTTLDDSKWDQLREIRNENLAEIKRRFPGCQVDFVEGDSRMVLAKLFCNGDSWDFFYQDSMHFFKGIKAEWDALEPHAAAGAVAIFDDITPTGSGARFSLLLDRCFAGWFARRSLFKGWSYAYSSSGHGQLWTRKSQ